MKRGKCNYSGQSIVMLWMVILCAMGRHVSGQGTITFANPMGAPVYDIDALTPLSGSGYLAELYAAAPGSSLQPISASLTAFSTGAPGYFFNAIDVAVPGTVIGGSAVVQVVAWRASDGGTFAIANHPGGHTGSSKIFTVVGLGNLGSPPLPGAPLIGMRSFSLSVVPEPSGMAVGIVGVAVLLSWRALLHRGRVIGECCHLENDAGD